MRARVALWFWLPHDNTWLFFFFLIGNKIYIKETSLCTKCPHEKSQNYNRLEWKGTERHEAVNSVTVVATVKPHILDQSNKEVTNMPSSWSGRLETSSKVLEFLSHHTVPLNTKELNSKCENDASQTSFATQIINPPPASAEPNGYEKNQKQKSTASEQHYNVVTNDPPFLLHTNTYNTIPPLYILSA